MMFLLFHAVAVASGSNEITPTLFVTVLSALGLLSGLGLGVKAFYERKSLRAKANSEDANATAIVVAAARELVDPLREELANERAEHKKQRDVDHRRYADEVEVERQKTSELRRELDNALADVQKLTNQVVSLRAQVSELEERLRSC